MLLKTLQGATKMLAAKSCGPRFAILFVVSLLLASNGSAQDGLYDQSSSTFTPNTKTSTQCALEFEVDVTGCSTSVTEGASMCAVNNVELLRPGTFETVACCNSTTTASTCPNDQYTFNNVKTFSALVDEKEVFIKGLATEARTSVEGRCFNLANCPSDCSIKSCSDDVGAGAVKFGQNTQCAERFGKLDQCPGAANCEGRMLNFENSVVLMASETGYNRSIADEFICGTRNLDTWFKSQYTNDLMWTYFGDIYGQSRFYPGYMRERTPSGCNPYDPRIRPWYLAATSGPKDVVIVLDISGSMNSYKGTKSRIQMIKDTLNGEGNNAGLLDTFSFADYISIVLFNGDAQVLRISNDYANEEYLVQATSAHIAQAKQAVSGITASGSTDFRKGFKKAFDVLVTSAKAEGHTSECSSVIVFLTDGRDGECEQCNSKYHDNYGACKCTENMLSEIEANQKRLTDVGHKKAAIFTYSMGSGADNSIPRSIACRNQGSWANILDGEDPITKMRGYYKFLARTNINSDGVFWTEPYDDDATGEKVTTAAKAVYESSGGKHLLGVVGVDVPLEALDQQYSSNYNSFLSGLSARSKACFYNEPDGCEMQMLRGDHSCAASFPENKCCFKPSGSGTTYVMVQKAASWEIARKKCEDLFPGNPEIPKGHLASPSNKAEMDFVSGIVPSDGAWIGLHQTSQMNEPAGNWNWVGGSSYPLDTVWSSGEPNNYDGDEHCAKMDSRGSMYNVNDERCDKTLPFVCEIPYDLGHLTDKCNDCSAYGVSTFLTATSSGDHTSEESGGDSPIGGLIGGIAGAIGAVALAGGCYYKNRRQTNVTLACCSSGVNVKNNGNVGDGAQEALPQKITKKDDHSHNVTNITYNYGGGAPPSPHHDPRVVHPGQQPQYGVQMTQPTAPVYQHTTGYPSNHANAYPTNIN